MATITAGDFRNGKTFEMDGKVMQVVEFQHVKPGKGAAFVRTKMRNVVTGAVTETSFNPTAKFEEAFVDRRDMAYSYNDGDLYYFMDQETFDMVPLNKELLGDAFRFITENTVCKVLSYKGSVFGLECPNFMDLEVTETEPGLAGNTATNTLKPATVETGAEVKVPLFINIGDKITIDTRTGEYLGRALAGLDVLEFHDLHDLAVHFKGLTVTEIAGGNGCHMCILPCHEKIILSGSISSYSKICLYSSIILHDNRCYCKSQTGFFPGFPEKSVSNKAKLKSLAEFTARRP